MCLKEKKILADILEYQSFIAPNTDIDIGCKNPILSGLYTRLHKIVIMPQNIFCTFSCVILFSLAYLDKLIYCMQLWTNHFDSAINQSDSTSNGSV